jgi:hypothetical protein
MHNIDTRYAATTRPAVKPAVVANGWFGEGNSAIGQKATEVSADWLNDVQGALLSVLDSAEVEPEKGNSSVFLTALEKVIENKISNLFLTKYKKVGSIEIRHDESNPADDFGGTWVLMPAGYTLVNLDESDITLNAVGKLRGSKTVQLQAQHIPRHRFTGNTAENGEHSHAIKSRERSGSADTVGDGGTVQTHTAQTESAGLHSHAYTTDYYGDDVAHENMQPSVVVRIWRRTA